MRMTRCRLLVESDASLELQGQKPHFSRTKRARNGAPGTPLKCVLSVYRDRQNRGDW